ncbi:MAG: Flp pilus assembly protein CpaB [Actinobacteria bacterium]|nr:Flp pilus assembly protein CpaB [Actinomycetota bacterium]
MKGKRGILLVAVLLSLVSVGLVYTYFQTIKSTSNEGIARGNVVVAVSDIPAHSKVTEEMLDIVAVPIETIHSQAAVAKEELVGLTTTVDVTAGEQFLTSKVAGEDEATSLSYRIPENMRAISIPVTEVSGVSGYVEQGDKVDLLISYETLEISPGGGYTTFTQLQDLEVLKVGPLDFDEDGAIVNSQGVTTSVVLLAKPEQAEIISFAILSGSIQMSLRNPVDNTLVPFSQYSAQNFDEWRTR